MRYNGIVKMVQLKWLQLNGLLKNGLFPSGRGLPIFDFRAQNMEKLEDLSAVFICFLNAQNTKRLDGKRRLIILPGSSYISVCQRDM